MVTAAGDPQHFLELGRIPVVGSATRLGQVCEMIGRQQVGAVIVRRRAQPAYYLTAPFLKQAVHDVVAAHGEKGFVAAANKPVGELVHEFKTSRPRIEPGASIIDIVERFPVEVAHRPIQASANVDKFLGGPPRVFTVMDGRRQAGWLLNHEGLAGTVSLKPPTWTCTNPNTPHENYDFDHGRCARCPHPLKP